MRSVVYATAYCPILEDAELDAMSDAELIAERANWCIPPDDDDPTSNIAYDNYRLVERHHELRAMSDEALSVELGRARSLVESWAAVEPDQLIPRIAHNAQVDLAAYEREMRRRSPRAPAETMPPEDIRAARMRLGLTLAELGALLGLDRRAMSRLEAPVGAATHRTPPARAVRLLNAYMTGYRPADWPKK